MVRGTLETTVGVVLAHQPIQPVIAVCGGRRNGATAHLSQNLGLLSAIAGAVERMCAGPAWSCSAGCDPGELVDRQPPQIPKSALLR